MLCCLTLLVQRVTWPPCLKNQEKKNEGPRKSQPTRIGWQTTHRFCRCVALMLFSDVCFEEGLLSKALASADEFLCGKVS